MSEPERLRTAIVLRGFTPGQFARFAAWRLNALASTRGAAGRSLLSQALITALLHGKH